MTGGSSAPRQLPRVNSTRTADRPNTVSFIVQSGPEARAWSLDISERQSQRDSDPKPRVARNELPWDLPSQRHNPNGVAASIPNVPFIPFHLVQVVWKSRPNTHATTGETSALEKRDGGLWSRRRGEY